MIFAILTKQIILRMKINEIRVIAWYVKEQHEPEIRHPWKYISKGLLTAGITYHPG